MYTINPSDWSTSVTKCLEILYPEFTSLASSQTSHAPPSSFRLHVIGRCWKRRNRSSLSISNCKFGEWAGFISQGNLNGGYSPDGLPDHPPVSIYLTCAILLFRPPLDLMSPPCLAPSPLTPPFPQAHYSPPPKASSSETSNINYCSINWLRQ